MTNNQRTAPASPHAVALAALAERHQVQITQHRTPFTLRMAPRPELAAARRSRGRG